MKQDYAPYNDKEVSNQIKIFVDKLISKESYAFLPKDQMKEVILVMGKTGAGKSTIMNLMQGHQMKAEEYKGKSVISVVGKTASQISHGAISCTTTPIILRDKLGVWWVDCPGFLDTKGPEQEIINAFYIKNIFEKATQVKILIVMEDSCTKNRLTEINELFRTLEGIFGNDIRVCMNKCALLVTKGSEEKIEKLKKRLTAMSSDMKSKSQNWSYFCNDLTENALCRFRQYEEDEKIQNQKIAFDVREALQRRKFFLQKETEVNIEISHEAKIFSQICLHRSIQVVLRKFQQIGNEIDKMYSTQNLDKINNQKLEVLGQKINKILLLKQIIVFAEIPQHCIKFHQALAKEKLEITKECENILRSEIVSVGAVQILKGLNRSNQILNNPINLHQYITKTFEKIQHTISSLIHERHIKQLEVDIENNKEKELQKLREIAQERKIEKEQNTKRERQLEAKLQTQQKKAQSGGFWSTVGDFCLKTTQAVAAGLTGGLPNLIITTIGGLLESKNKSLK